VRRGDWGEVVEYVDKPSGEEGKRRPELEGLLETARTREIDVVMVWKLNCLGRSTLDVLDNILLLESHGVRFLCPSINLDTHDPSPEGKVTLPVLSAIAETVHKFESSCIGRNPQGRPPRGARRKAPRSARSRGGQGRPQAATCGMAAKAWLREIRTRIVRGSSDAHTVFDNRIAW